jgi:neutral ceramidase
MLLEGKYWYFHKKNDRFVEKPWGVRWMMTQRMCGWIGALLCLFFLVLQTSAAIEVGVAVNEIRVDEGVTLWGYEQRVDPWVGVWDPLKVKAISFDDGQSKAAMVVLDLGRTPAMPELTYIKEEAKKRYDVSFVMVMATHTHDGPALGKDPSPNGWEKELSENILQTIGQSIKNKKNARFRTATGQADITYDRRVVNEDGSITMLWQNHERKHTVPIDQNVRVVYIDDTEGRPIVTLAHYACHPVLGGIKNLKLSADFPVSLCAFVEKNIGGACVFMQGACGNINPYMAAILTTDSGYDTVIQEGETVGKSVVQALEEAIPVDDDHAIRFTFFEEEVGIKKNKDEDFDHLLRWMYGAEFIEGVQQGVLNSIPVQIPILAIGDSLAWVGFPGEFFDLFQVDLAERSPIPNTYFLGYCNGYLSYFPTIRAAAEGGYGASYGLITEVGAGEYLLDRSIIALYDLLGKFDREK